MKKIISMTITLAMLLCLLSGCENGNTDDSRAGGKNVANYADYYPYNTFTDCDENYIYFSTYKGILDTDSVDTGIYRIPRQGDQAELIYKNDASKSVDDVVYTPNILSIAVWHKYIYFLRDHSVYRLSVDGGECRELLSREELAPYLLQTPNSLRIFNDILYVSTVNIDYLKSYIAFDLTESDTLKAIHTMNTSENCETAPLYDIVQLSDGDYQINHCPSKFHMFFTFFDYQSNCVGFLLKDALKLYDHSGHLLTDIHLKSDCPFLSDSSDSGDGWANLSDKKAYKFFRLKAFSDAGELISQNDKYSLVIYDLENDSYKTVRLEDDDLPLVYNIDVIDGKAYWWGKNNVVCYKVSSDHADSQPMMLLS